jgi:hypothetical protein
MFRPRLSVGSLLIIDILFFLGEEQLGNRFSFCDLVINNFLAAARAISQLRRSRHQVTVLDE